MGRRTDTIEIGDAKVIAEALSFEASEDLLPEVLDIISATFERVAPMFAEGGININDEASVVKLLPALGAIAQRVGGGRLKRLAPQILAGTSVIMPGPDGTASKYDLVKKEDRAAVFEARPELYLRVLLFAGKVTFGPFLRGGAPAAKASPKAT